MARDLFTTLDLNLLKTLSVLAQENNMRRASERLHVTQPALSTTLAGLRMALEDDPRMQGIIPSTKGSL